MSKQILCVLLLLLLVSCVRTGQSTHLHNSKDIYDMVEAVILLQYDAATKDPRYHALRAKRLSYLTQYPSTNTISAALLSILYAAEQAHTGDDRKTVQLRCENTITVMYQIFMAELKKLSVQQKEDYIVALFMKHKPLYDYIVAQKKDPAR